MFEYRSYVGLDVHKEMIAVAIVMPGREEPVFRGEIRNQRSSLRRLVRNLSPHGEVLSFCYEAGSPARGARENRLTRARKLRPPHEVLPYPACGRVPAIRPDRHTSTSASRQRQRHTRRAVARDSVGSSCKRG